MDLHLSTSESLLVLRLFISLLESMVGETGHEG